MARVFGRRVGPERRTVEAVRVEVASTEGTCFVHGGEVRGRELNYKVAIASRRTTVVPDVMKKNEMIKYCKI